MTNVELFEDTEIDEVENSKIVLQVFSVKGGFLPNWFLEVRDDATFEELLALRDGVELVRVQFDKMMDIMIAQMGVDDNE